MREQGGGQNSIKRGAIKSFCELFSLLGMTISTVVPRCIQARN